MFMACLFFPAPPVSACYRIWLVACAQSLSVFSHTCPSIVLECSIFGLKLCHTGWFGRLLFLAARREEEV